MFLIGIILVATLHVPTLSSVKIDPTARSSTARTIYLDNRVEPNSRMFNPQQFAFVAVVAYYVDR